MDLEMEDATSNQRSSWDVTKYFMIKPNDGKIILKQMVDYERAHEYRFSVVVKDSGIPPLSSTARVVVQGEKNIVVFISTSGQHSCQHFDCEMCQIASEKSHSFPTIS